MIHEDVRVSEVRQTDDSDKVCEVRQTDDSDKVCEVGHVGETVEIDDNEISEADMMSVETDE